MGYRRQGCLAIALIALCALAGVPAGARTAPAAAQNSRPNFVFVLTDDLSWNLVQYMGQVRQMQREGATFNRYFVTDSLCCPSRSTIFTGRYPHSTGVITNSPPDGGFTVFHRSEERDTFATSLQAAGYDTAMMGKYVNGYLPRRVVDGSPHYVPPGWSVWSVAGNGYPEFNYNLLQKTYAGQPQTAHYGSAPQDYLTDVISRRGQGFIRSSVGRGHPFILELATFAPHGPYTPAPRDSARFPNAHAPRGALFDRPQRRPRPKWLKTRRLSPDAVAKIDRDFRKRVQAVQAVDQMIADIRAELARLGVARNTYLVFSSDNGYHMGQRRLLEGKQTAWDHDIRVPLVVVGPGVSGGRRVSSVTANTDLRPTFQQLAGAPVAPRVEGRSLVPLLRGDTVRKWRRVTVVEHHGPNTDPNDPDHATKYQGNPPSYKALRFPNALWVQYDNRRFRAEYYNLRKDPNERHNVAAALSKKRRRALRAIVRRFEACSDGPACHAADRG
jgi:N-acetylglucosamine-6-sulfatase